LGWTGQLKTVDPESIEDALFSMTTAVASELKEANLIR
jgi:hypothetical protein